MEIQSRIGCSIYDQDTINLLAFALQCDLKHRDILVRAKTKFNQAIVKNLRIDLHQIMRPKDVKIRLFRINSPISTETAIRRHTDKRSRTIGLCSQHIHLKRIGKKLVFRAIKLNTSRTRYLFCFSSDGVYVTCALQGRRTPFQILNFLRGMRLWS